MRVGAPVAQEIALLRAVVMAQAIAAAMGAEARAALAEEQVRMEPIRWTRKFKVS